MRGLSTVVGVAAGVLLCLSLGCGGATGGPGTVGPGPTGDGAGAPASDRPVVIVGELTRERIEAEAPGWREARESARPDPEAAQALGAVPPGSLVTVYLGTWCGDSRREVPRLWAALDLLGAEPPFELRYVGVDRAKSAPGDLLSGVELEYVPTFVVTRGGTEVGRIVESAPGGVERDLGDLLRGDQTGIVSGREDQQL